jgi:hypothetical protein
MPETTITIDRDQRGGLYELVRNRRDDTDIDRRFQLGYETCQRALVELDPRGGQSA